MLEKGTILTGADQLLDIVRKHNVISLGKAARMLESSPERIQLLAESLEEHGTIVTYYTLGDVLLVEKEHYEATKGRIGLIKPILLNILSFGVRNKQKSDSEQRAKELDALSKTIAKRAQLLEKRSKQLEHHAESLEVAERSLREREQHVERSVAGFEKRENELREERDRLERARAELDKREKRIAQRLEKARRILN